MSEQLPSEKKVGCEGDDGLLRVHSETATCDVCEKRTKEKKVRRLKQGRDYHAWAWKHTGNDRLKGFFHFSEPFKPNKQWENPKPSEKGKWVRVKFVEVRS